MKAIWKDLLSEHDQKCLANASEFSPKRGLGKSPAIMVIDMQYSIIGEDKPIYEQQDVTPYACGNFAWEAIRHLQKLLPFARENKIPIVYTRNVYRPESGFVFPETYVFRIDNPGSKIIAELEPVVPGDIVLEKNRASAFFCTPLLYTLLNKGIDTLIITGNTTSGCVRATAIDATGYNFKTAVVEECIFDRLEMAHKASLFDLQYKYCDVLTLDETYEYLNGLKK